MALSALLTALNLEQHEPALREAELTVDNLCGVWRTRGWSGLGVALRRATTFQADELGRARFWHALVHSHCSPSAPGILPLLAQTAATGAWAWVDANGKRHTSTQTAETGAWAWVERAERRLEEDDGAEAAAAERAWPFAKLAADAAEMGCQNSTETRKSSLQPALEANVTSCSAGPTLHEGGVPLFVRWEEYVPRYLASANHVRFVQFGANCGRNTKSCAVGGDPVWNYVQHCGWRGLAFEPVAGTFQELCRNVAAIGGRVRPLRAVISNETGSAWMKINAPDGGERSHVMPAPQSGTEPSSLVQRTPSLSLHDVWSQDGVDVLIVDAEGFVERVLGYSPLPTPLPQLVLFEHVYLSEPQRARIDANLLGQGFHRIADLRHMDARGANAPPQDRLYGRLRIKPQ